MDWRMMIPINISVQYLKIILWIPSEGSVQVREQW